MKKKRFLLLILPIVTLILEILPYGAVCNFANPEGDSFRKTFSYFSLTPYGYANFTPFITAVLTCIIFALLIAYCINEKPRFLSASTYLLYACTVFSLCPLFYGTNYFSVVGALISISLLAELVVIRTSNKNL